MESKSRYVPSMILVQVVVIPILMTVGVICASMLFSSLISNAGSNHYNSEWIKLLNIVVALIGPLLLGTIIGFLFSKWSKEKPVKARKRYLFILLPIVYILSFTIAAYVISKGDYTAGIWQYYKLKNPGLLFLHLGLSFSRLDYLMPIIEISCYIGFGVGIFLQERLSRTYIKDKSALAFKLSFTILCTAFLVSSYFDVKDIVSNGILELRSGSTAMAKELTEFDLIKIAPFKDNNGLASLDKEASLQFEDLQSMPKLDGATAAYPVYASFVQAVYKGLGDYYEANKSSIEEGNRSAFVNSSTFPLNIVQCTKTDGAYERLINGETDIIFAAEPSKGQIQRIKEKGDDFELTPIGFEAFVFFTNIKNPVGSLSIEEIQGIYSGKITNWNQVGGSDYDILPYQRPVNSGSQTIMENKVMKDIKMIAPTGKTFAGTMGGIIHEVASYKNSKNSIGYSFMYYSSKMIRSNQIKYIGINGIKPTTETVRNKTYPFTVPVYAVTLKSNKDENVDKLLKWILSGEGQSLIEKTGYVSIR